MIVAELELFGEYFLEPIKRSAVPNLQGVPVMLNTALSHILHTCRVLFTLLKRNFENLWHSHTILKEKGKGGEREEERVYHLLASYFVPGLPISY